MIDLGKKSGQMLNRCKFEEYSSDDGKKLIRSTLMDFRLVNPLKILLMMNVNT